MSEGRKSNGVQKRRSTRVSDEIHEKRPKPGPRLPSQPAAALHPCLRGCADGRQYTVSIAVPGSVMLKQPSLQLKTQLASSIARAAAIYCVDEIVVFDEACSLPAVPGSAGRSVDAAQAYEKHSWDPSVHLALLLQYLECPQYLRKHVFPRQAALACAGLASPLALPSHVAADEQSPYRDGIVVSREDDSSVSVDVGLSRAVPAHSEGAPLAARVTVRMPRRADGEYRIVAPSIPRRKRGIYWGFTVRLANGLSGVWHGCPFAEEEEEKEEEEEEEEEGVFAKSGYDLIVGTSERGSPVEEFDMPTFKHLLVVFGGPTGLETSLELDESLAQVDPSRLFPVYLNTCVGQGSRTIRTEEAIIVTMAALNQQIKAKGTAES